MTNDFDKIAKQFLFKLKEMENYYGKIMNDTIEGVKDEGKKEKLKKAIEDYKTSKIDYEIFTKIVTENAN
jgi:hypothetical protein